MFLLTTTWSSAFKTFLTFIHIFKTGTSGQPAAQPTDETFSM
jgi:hypothetical protein